MGKIAVLDQSTINQIAAGEVIERPASVVKELIENSIDAMATMVTVEIKEGGISFIRITDNGIGISKEDVETAFLRHATSKIKTAIDLLTVSSLGFRGEALSSIAAVSMVELVSKRKQDLYGSRYEIAGGKGGSLEEIGVPDGTTFIVRNLFYNTPARRKFLKTAQTEAGYINDIVCKVALAHPEVSFRFINNGKHILHTSGNGKLKDVIYAIYGKDIALNLLELNYEDTDIKISGYIGKPVINRGNRNYENYFINGRYIKSGVVNKAIEEGYRNFMMQHKYPFTAIHFTVNTELLDVNVHPTKMELRFRNADEIYPAVINTITDALKEKELIRQVGFDKEKDVSEKMQKVTIEKTPESFEEKRMEKQSYENPYLKAIRQQQKKEDDTKYTDVKITFAKSSNTVQSIEKKYSTDNEAKRKPEAKEFEAKEAVAEKLADNNEMADNKEAIVKENLAKELSDNKETVVEENADKDLTAEKTADIKYYTDDNNENAENVHLVAEDTSTYKKAEQMELFDDKLLSKEARQKHKIVGQLFETYWIIEYMDKMFIIDQHAAHEKVLFERTMKRLRDRKTMTQSLNPPILLTLSLREAEIIKEYDQYFREIGYEIEEFGGNEYAVRAVPFDLFSVAKKELLLELIDDLADEFAIRRKSELILDRVATMSCKAAVKGNNKLSFQEANALIDELMELENPYNCPHGRPTIISMTKYELEKKFKRIV